MKNLVIILALICAVLGYLLVMQPRENTANLDRSALIQSAEIEGISLSTDLNKVDGLVKKSGFECNKTESKQTNVKDTSQSIIWKCKHMIFDRTSFNITAVNGKIMTMYRAGQIDFKKAAAILNYIDALKMRLNTRENVYFNQTSITRTALSLKDKADDRTENLQFRLDISKRNNSEGQVEDVAHYVATLSSR